MCAEPSFDPRDSRAASAPGPTAARSKPARSVTASSLIEMCRDEPMVVRRVVVEPRQVVYVKGIVEASAGLATMVADGGGELVLVTAAERAAELDELLDDLREEIGLRVRGAVGGVACGGEDHG